MCFSNWRRMMRTNDIVQKNPVMNRWILNAFLPNHLVNFCPFICSIKTSDSIDTARKTEMTVKMNKIEFNTFPPGIHRTAPSICQMKASWSSSTIFLHGRYRPSRNLFFILYTASPKFLINAMSLSERGPRRITLRFSSSCLKLEGDVMQTWTWGLERTNR